MIFTMNLLDKESFYEKLERDNTDINQNANVGFSLFSGELCSYENTEKNWSEDNNLNFNATKNKNHNDDSQFEEFNNNINKIQNIYNKFDNFEINNNITTKYYIKQNFIKKYNIYIKKNNDFDNVYECPICYDNICLLNHIKLDCKHFLCKNCYEKWNKKCYENNIKVFCPLCRN